MATTTTIKHSAGDIHHQNTVTLHHLGSLSHMKTEGNLFAYSVSGESSSDDLILYTSSQMNGSMDFLLEGVVGGNGSGGSSASTSSSSHESIANLLDEGLGTSLDGTDEISTSIHSTLGRNDSGVFSGDEAGGLQQTQSQPSTSSSNCSSSGTLMDTTPATPTAPSTTTEMPSPTFKSLEEGSPGGTRKKNRSKTSSPNRQGPQRCAICGKTFSNASALTKHKLTHSDERKHACPMCGKAFKRQDHLNGHMLTHRNKKPFECTSKGCGKSYCDARSLRRHVESRHGNETLAIVANSGDEHGETNNNNPDHPPLTKTGRKKGSTKANTANSVPALVNTLPQPQPQQSPPVNTEETPSEMLASMVGNESLLLESDVLELDTELFPTEDPTFDMDVVEVKMEAMPQEEVESKYVMVKMEEILVNGGCEQEVLLNNNNLILSPEAMASLMAGGVTENQPIQKFPTVKIAKSSMRPSQSQLHQLLTQRAMNGTSSIGAISTTNSSPITTTTVVSVTPCAPSKDSTGTGVTGSNWSPNVNKEELTKCCTAVPTKGSAIESSVLGQSGGRKQGTGAKGSGGNGTSSPALLKEQLELIHQIIQQAQEESIISNSTPPAGKPTKGKKSKANSTAAASAAAALANPASACFSKYKLEVVDPDGKDDKPVECTICCRRFKNTPALNGHMRLHGGYFKGGKDPDGKKKDSSSKESANTPLQTASVSIRALIEEKIIQKRNTTTVSTQGTPETHSGPSTTLCGEDQGEESFQFIYSEDQDNADYLLMEEEVFNKVSSICPDSFLDGIDESILSAATATEELGSEWNWAPGTDARLTSIFNNTACSDSPPQSFCKVSGGSGGPFTPLPPLDSGVFYSSPTPQSPSIHSQDSPCFMYPTPPASLESHNALQSPLFPFPSSGGTQLLYPFEPTQPSFTCPPTSSRQSTIINMMEIDGHSPLDSSIFTNVPTTTSSAFSTTGSASPTAIDVNSLLSDTNFNNLPSSDGAGESVPSAGTPSPMIVRHFGNLKARNASGGSSSETVNFLTPSCSPSLLGSSSTEDSIQSVKELKVNETARMDCSLVDGDVFLNPNRVPSPCIKSPKRKQVRNTLASNLRPQTTPGPATSGASTATHFTPYPILSPVRSAPGLYWTFSPKLSHVDDTKRERPRINVGSDFQVTELPSARGRKRKWESLVDEENLDGDGNDSSRDEESLVMREDHLWDPTVLNHCTVEEVDKYLEFACCSAVPGGGRNKEYALHLLSLCNGDINSAIILLMNREPVLPAVLTQYKYPEKEKWSREEILIFQDALLKHGKDFVQVAKEIQSKRSEDCVIFYQLWKKVCSAEYDKIRNVWKKRDATFTLDLLKNVPPPTTCPNPRPHPNISQQLDFADSKNDASVLKSSDSPSPSTSMIEVVNSLSLQSHEEFPCKVCGKVFNKVKSRSAHMKSHRPPDPPPEGTQILPFHKKNAPKFASKAPSNPVMKPKVLPLNNNNLNTPNKSLIPALTQAQPKPQQTQLVLDTETAAGRSNANRDT